MEMFLVMGFGAVAVGFFVRTYWDVYQAWRAWVNASRATRPGEVLVVAPTSR